MSRDDNFLLLVLICTLGIAGMIVWHIQGANRQTGRLIVEILFFTGMSLVPFMASIAPHQPDGIARLQRSLTSRKRSGRDDR
ncbi:hypothetical protein GYN07_21990 [Rhizobium leguminosarum bv. viciae 248]|uniref:hypothetical protein n=1 Tax=Rhizobium leguminosarum TaxID=384 RepID=UPI00037C3F76|nr:hypothetical protein [Rhizobium leguminosarum]MCA2410726.1 hypothetical protein [Rhizobium leguminosarum]NKM63891.1 hypothetical protein [Rhizobium leguminosarum bv. viciae]QHW26841.1 hypothetical protein GYN07_21990 [Rhizobium leguminosarum bv. viciae 248]